MFGKFVTLPLLIVVLAFVDARPAHAQAGFSISPTTWSVAAAGGAQAVTITSTLPDAPWTASSNAGWLTVSTALGTGSSTVTLTAAANTTSATPRVATATVAGHSVTVTQAGVTPDATLNPTSWVVGETGGTLNVVLTTTDPGAPWIASSTAAWVTPGVSGGTGSATITLTAGPHTTSARPRSANVTIAGVTFGVTQSGATPAFTLAPQAWNPPAAGGSASVTVTSSLPDAPWAFTINAAWLSGELAGPVSTAWMVKTLAGGTQGYAEGRGTAARFSQPLSAAVDNDGNLYVADRWNNRIRKITPEGVVTTLAGSLSGFADGTGAAALFSGPYGVAFDGSDTLYVADTFNNRIRKVTLNGVVTTLAGGTLGTADGAGAAAQFAYPTGLAVGADGVVYVADFQNDRIRTISPGGVVTTLAGSTQGYAEGTGAAAKFSRPFGLTVNRAGTVYVADSQNHRIRQITPAGMVTTLAGSTPGNADGVGAAAQFRLPFGVAVNGAGQLYVADTLNNRVRQITPAGDVTTLEGSTLTPDGIGPAPQFRDPGGVAVDALGRNLFIVDSSNHRIQQWALTTVGSATLRATAEPTSTVLPRGATITMGGETLTVTQDGGTAVLGVSTTSWAVPAGGGTQAIQVSSNYPDAPWGVTTSAPWLTANPPTSGAGPGTVRLTAAATTSSAVRLATATIAGRTVTVTQAGGTPVFGLDRSSWAPAASGHAAVVNVTSSLVDAPWAASSSAGWLTVSAPGGTGPGSLTLTAAPHSTSALPRTATATIAGLIVSVTQAGAAAQFSLDPASWNVPASGGSLGVTVTSTLSDAAWTASSGAGWLTLDVAGGTGRGTITVNAAAHGAAVLRTGAVTIAGATFSVTQGPAPRVALDRTRLFFGAVTTGGSFERQTSAQVIRLTQSGAGTVTWTATTSHPWLTVSPSSGTGTAALTVSVAHAAELPVNGTADGQVTITLTGASNTVAPIAVGLNLFPSAMAAPAVGVIDTPVDGGTDVTGSIAVTGWALDDVEVVSVGLYRDPVAPEPAGGLVFVGNAVFVDNARPDLVGSFPRTPRNTRGGWGYMLLTNMLPNQGNGTFRFYAIATDREGNQTVLQNTPAIAVDNASSSAPFGAIDTPGQGETVSGMVNNFGWVLVRDGARVDVPGGGSVVVYIDGVPVGVPGSWTGRSDITQAFPAGYAELASTAAVYSFDSRALSNGVHTIAWGVEATNGQPAGVGSRYFTVSNGVVASLDGPGLPGGASMAFAARAPAAVLLEAAHVSSLAPGESLLGRRGFDLRARYRTYRQGSDGAIVVPAQELDRVELRLDGGAGAIRDTTYAAYLQTGGQLGTLPVGASLDPSTGTFTWQPGVGFVGLYDFVFVRLVGGEPRARHDVRIVLHPESSGRVGPQIVIDAPPVQQDVAQPFVVAGWAVDLDDDAASGVDAVHVWAYPLTGEPPIFLGPAAYGGRRSDVGAMFGDRFERSGFGLAVRGLEPGHYDLAVFAWSGVTQNFVPARTVRVTVR